MGVKNYLPLIILSGFILASCSTQTTTTRPPQTDCQKLDLGLFNASWPVTKKK